MQRLVINWAQLSDGGGRDVTLLRPGRHSSVKMAIRCAFFHGGLGCARCCCRGAGMMMNAQ
jgi:hypothetical protein